MNPMPPLEPIVRSPALVSAMEILMLIAVVSLAVLFGMLLWNALHQRHERARVRCPVEKRPAQVVFRLAPGGQRTGVLRCSLLGAAQGTCAASCLHPL